jgi:DNA-binding NarL/FixJ family response regulator
MSPGAGNVSLPLRVVLADDQVLFRQMMVETLSEEADIEVVGEAGDGEEAVELCRRLHPDIILLDISMPRMDGIEATRRIVSAMPSIKVVILTAFDEELYIFDLIEAGATGYLLKDSPTEQVVRAVRAAASGESLIQPSIANKILHATRRLLEREKSHSVVHREGFETLTEREREVLSLVGRGLNNREICEALFIGEATVKTHVTNILSKMHFRDRVEAVLFAVQVGLAALPSEA